MRVPAVRERAAVLLLAFLFAGAEPASAQSPDRDTPAPDDATVIVVTPERIVEADAWAREFADWQVWAEQYLNRRQQGIWNNFVERRQKPDPPVWLEELCGLLSADDEFKKACGLLPAWREAPLVAHARRASAAALQQKEAPKNSVWWQHIHVDGMWSSTQSNVAAFGLFGAHVTVDVTGRMQAFMTPGILLVSVPSMYSGRELAPATDWGLTYRLFNVGRSTVHFNFVHAWMIGSRAGLLHTNMNLAGLSVSFRRTDADKRLP